jgi:global regulator protein family protein
VQSSRACWADLKSTWVRSIWWCEECPTSIGADIVVTVLEVRGDQIRIGIDAPRSVSVHREEVFRELEAAN